MNHAFEPVIRCDLCGAQKNRIIDQKGHIVQCRSCGLKFVNPRPTQEAIAEIYDWNYDHCRGWSEIDPQAQIIYERRFSFLERFRRGGKILDVGAGRGEFLAEVGKSNRWQCYGSDTSQQVIEFAKNELGLKLALGQVEDLVFPDNFFDAVSLWHVLEHLPSPSRAISEIRRILKDKGFLFIAVPNDSWLGRRHFFKNEFKKVINRLPLKKKLKLKKMYPEIEEDLGNQHLFYFTPGTLTRMLRRHDFRINILSVDYNYGQPNKRIESRYRLERLLCRFTGINLSKSILIAAQKE